MKINIWYYWHKVKGRLGDVGNLLRDFCFLVLFALYVCVGFIGIPIWLLLYIFTGFHYAEYFENKIFNN